MSNELERFGRIGGTTVSAIVGQNPWATPHSAYLQLRREVEPTPDNEAMARGRAYEPVIADLFATGNPEYRVAHNRQGTDEPELYVDERYPFLIGHPDRLLYDKETNKLVAGLEIKTANIANKRFWGEVGTDAIPTNYLIQCQWYAGLAKLPYWIVAVQFLNGSVADSFREYRVVADSELFDALVESAVDFWENHVVPGIPPEIEAVDETTKRWVAQRFPRNVEPLEAATPQEEQIMAKFLLRKDALEAAQKEYEQAETALKLAIGNRDGLTSETFGKVTWKSSKDSKRVDYHAICDELHVDSDLIERHTKTVAGTRRFCTTGMRINL